MPFVNELLNPNPAQVSRPISGERQRPRSRLAALFRAGFPGTVLLLPCPDTLHNEFVNGLEVPALDLPKITNCVIRRNPSFFLCANSASPRLCVYGSLTGSRLSQPQDAPKNAVVR